MRASMRIGPDAPGCACAHAQACKIARACARICLSRIEYHNLATCAHPAEHAAGARTHRYAFAGVHAGVL